MSDVRGIFRLKQVYEEQLSGNWSVKSDVWLSPSPFFGPAPETGYFGGGTTGSTVDRIDYSNDTATASPKGPLSLARRNLAATGNSSFGYFGGGFPGISTIDRIDYSNDTSTASPKGSLSLARYALAATGNSSFGYFGGGYTSSFLALSTVDCIDYSNDTATASPKGPLSLARGYLAATGNQSYGYFGSSFYGSSTVDRIDYSNDTATASPKGPLSAGRSGLAATGNSSFGYFGGGQTTSSVDSIDYSNDTATASPKGPLSLARWGLAATGNSSFGYFGGGRSNTSTGYSTVDRIDYSNDTSTASPKGPLSAARYGLAATSPKANALPTINIIFSAPPGGLTNFATGAVASTNTGYFGGDYSPQRSTVDRIDYSNDTSTASPKGPLSVARGLLAATGNSSFGYFGGYWSWQTNYFSLVDRIDYSNDTSTASVRGPLSVARGFLAATGNSSFGYFGGGGFITLYTTVDRIDYSNDTATASPKGPLSAGRYGLAATGNSSYGYFGGGRLAYPSATVLTTVDRIDYSNDTATASPKGPLSLARNALAATGNSSFGYFGGGSPFVPRSTVDRIDYSNDTATASPKGPLSSARYGVAATGNSSFGYFGGGLPGPLSTVDRIDYSNDTATASPKGPLSLARRSLAATSGRANGLPQVDSTLPPANSPIQVLPDLYPSYNSLLLRGDGTNGSTTFVDGSPTPKTVTAFGNAQISTAQSKFGGASMVFDGNGDYLSTPDNEAWNFGSGEFTIEFWTRPSGFGSFNSIVSQWPSNGFVSSNSFVVETVSNNTLYFYYVTSSISGSGFTGPTLTQDQWQHIAIVRSGNNLIFFKDGVQHSTHAFNVTLNNPTSALTVGGNVAGSGWWNGYIDDLRITKGVARYTTNFTPPGAL
jgi:hypothetical protein